MSPLVLTDLQSPLALLTLNRPERHNSLVPELLEALLAALAGVRENPEIRAVVLQANGPSFSTGGDLAGFRANLDELEAYAGRIVGLLNQAILAMLALDQPVVAAVDGPVTGGSLGLVLASDVVLVSPRASFTPYYSVVGFSPDGGWTALLPALIGLRRAAEVLLTNQTISARQAVDWGLASRIAAGDLGLEAVETARRIAAMQAGSLRRTKALLNRRFGNPAQLLELERLNFVEQIGREETRHSMQAFHDRMTRA